MGGLQERPSRIEFWIGKSVEKLGTDSTFPEIPILPSVDLYRISKNFKKIFGTLISWSFF